MLVITLIEFSHLGVKILIAKCLSSIVKHSMAMGTNHHLAAIPKSGPTWPQGVLSQIFLGV